MRPKLGELFAGYGGLGAGVQAVIDCDLAWYADVCKFDKDGNAGHYEPHRSPCSIMAHHHPDVPNIGDVSAVDWSTVEPVDILTGGSPCQDLSHAGRRKGMTEGTRSNLWVAMREAVAQLRPSLVVWENVRGAYSAAADSEMGWCDRCLVRHQGGGKTLPALRALGRVLGDLSDLGYDCRWHGLRAADVGAPHGRFRVFVVAYRNGEGRGGLGWQHALGRDTDGRGRADGLREAGESATLLPTPRATRGESNTETTALLGTPTARDYKGSGQGERLAESARRGQVEAQVLSLLPTPAVNDMGVGKTDEARDEWTAKMQAAHGNGNGHGKSLAIEAQRLLPTPVYTEARKATWQPSQHRLDGGHEVFLTNALYDAHHHEQDWGDYADAIARWEALTRPAPAPTQPSKKGTPQLSPAFSEWLMGLPEGHVTGVPGLSRNDQLKALGNGVVPQQAEAALRYLLSIQENAA